MHTAPAPPIPNAYWVEPLRLLAGEYPGTRRAEDTAGRLAALLAAGIDCFIDLTEPDELEPYEAVLRQVSPVGEADITWTRRPIRDFGVPTRPFMAALLDEVDGLLNAGHRVYVHCWGGVGRTGTVVGCYLVRHGMSGPEALAQLAAWWQLVPKHALHPRSPETDQQVQYILTWDGTR